MYQIAKDEDRKIENYYDEILGDRINDAIAKVYEENEYTTMENQFIFEANSDEELYEEFLQKFEEERQEVWYKIHRGTQRCKPQIFGCQHSYAKEIEFL